MKNVIISGARPTGKLHLGHYVGAIRQWVELQNRGGFDDYFVLIADAQALTDNADNPQKIRDNVLEVMLDYLSLGLDPNKITFFLQSEIRALPELTAYYMNLVSLPRVLRNPTVKTEIAQKDFDKVGVPVGFAVYPISQASDITAFKANLIPVGEDQEPMLEQTREIVKAFNRTYKTDVLVPCKSILPSNKESLRLPGIDGSAKMSKSIGNCIYLSDEPNEIKKKVNSIVTAPRRLEDPGETENSVLFTYLRAVCQDVHFEKFYPDFKNLAELEDAYKKGGIGDGKIKQFLFNVLNDILTPFREKRKELAQNLAYVIDVLKNGTQKANMVADQTLTEVKKAMFIDYFSNDEFLNEQKKRFSE